MKPWIVTGAAGFLGSHVVDALRGRDVPVVGVDNLAWGRREHLAQHAGSPGFRLAEIDIRDGAAMDELVGREAPEAIVHLAALHFIPLAVKDPALAVSVNVHGTQVVLAAAAKAKVPRLWFASTGDVYAPGEHAHRESEAPAPFNIYGLTKWIGEQLIALAARDGGDRAFVVGRLLNLYGTRETNPHILPEICSQLRARPAGPLRLGNVTPTRDLVPIKEAARAVIDSTKAAPPGVTTVNVATGAARSIQDMITEIGELLGRTIAVEVDPARVRPVERAHLRVDVSALRRLIGWAPAGGRDDVRAGLREMLAAEGVV